MAALNHSFAFLFQDKFFARLARDKDGHNIISIYEAPEMRLHNNTSITMDGVQVAGNGRHVSSIYHLITYQILLI